MPKSVQPNTVLVDAFNKWIFDKQKHSKAPITWSSVEKELKSMFDTAISQNTLDTLPNNIVEQILSALPGRRDIGIARTTVKALSAASLQGNPIYANFKTALEKRNSIINNLVDIYSGNVYIWNSPSARKALETANTYLTEYMPYLVKDLNELTEVENDGYGNMRYGYLLYMNDAYGSYTDLAVYAGRIFAVISELNDAGSTKVAQLNDTTDLTSLSNRDLYIYLKRLHFISLLELGKNVTDAVILVHNQNILVLWIRDVLNILKSKDNIAFVMTETLSHFRSHLKNLAMKYYEQSPAILSIIVSELSSSDYYGHEQVLKDMLPFVSMALKSETVRMPLNTRQQLSDFAQKQQGGKKRRSQRGKTTRRKV